MEDNLFEARYDLTKKSKLRRFYESNKILIYVSVFLVLILFGFLSYFLESKEKKRIVLSENYVQSKIYLESGDNKKALDLLKSIILANDATYSTLSLFMILNQNLLDNHNEISDLFDHLLSNNKYEKEIRNLLIYKKALYNSNYMNESELLEETKSLVNKDSIWKPYALLLLGDYFISKKEYRKAKDFYTQNLSINNLQKEIYDQAKYQLKHIANVQ